MSESLALLFIGNNYLKSGDNEKALDYLKASLPLLEQAGYTNYEYQALTDLSLAYTALGDKANAEKYSGMAREKGQ